MDAYETYQNTLGVKLSFLLRDEDKKHSDSVMIISYSAYEKRSQRDEKFRLRKGGGKDNEVLVRFESLNTEEKQEVTRAFGQVEKSKHILDDYFAIDGEARLFFEGFRFNDGTGLNDLQRSQYTLNASVLKALVKLRTDRLVNRRMRGGSSKGVSASLVLDSNSFNYNLLERYGNEHTLPNSEKLIKRINEFEHEGYVVCVDKRNRNQAASKVKEDEALALLEELLKKHTNLDSVQISDMYNTVASKIGWKTITSNTVANYKDKSGLFVYSGRRGATAFSNTKEMQHKRTAPEYAMTYWTLDGWDAELLYQKTSKNKKGHQVTTYYNRLTVCVVLDPSCKYPIGYAIGTHETPELIREALKNAVNHTKELFGVRYYPHQIQSDHYGNGALTPLYESLSTTYTPARVKNAKAKVVEPYFLRLNKKCQLFDNWSGFGITSSKDLQPNDEYLNKIRHSFPTEEACRMQLETVMQQERASKIDEFRKRFDALPHNDKLVLNTEKYLNLFGLVHTHTNKLNGEGLTPTLVGNTYTFDSYDMKFREFAYMDWAIKYDPEDMSCVLAVNAKRDSSGRVSEVVGTHNFLLEQKYVQPMALYDRKEGDAEELTRTNQFNKELRDKVLERGAKNREKIDELFTRPELSNTLAKLILVDSKGQHKNHKAIENKKVLEEPKSKQLPEKDTSYTIIEDDIRRSY